MLLCLLAHVMPSEFLRRILRSEALVYKSYFFSEQLFYGNYSTLDSHTISVISHVFVLSWLVKMASKTVTRSIIFLYAVRPRYANYLPCVSVFKVRPLVGQEKVHNASQCVRFIPDKPQLILGKDRGFTFDYVFSPKSSQVRYIVFK